MKLKNVGFIAMLCPFAVIAMTSCNGTNEINAPGKEITLTEAKKYVRENFETRVNLAESTTMNLSISNCKIHGVAYLKFSEEIDANRINLECESKNLLNDFTIANENGATGALSVKLGYSPMSIFTSDMSILYDNLFNPYLVSDELPYIESIKDWLDDSSAFETKYTLDGNNFYLSYTINDLEKVSGVIEHFAEIHPTESFVVPLAGKGSAKIVLGFDKYGYPIKLQARVDSDDLVVRAKASSYISDDPLFVGSAHLNVDFTNKVNLYENDLTHINFKQIDENGKEEKITYSYRAPKSEAESLAIPTEEILVDYNYDFFAEYFDTLLPGYGTKIVLEGLNNAVMDYPESTIYVDFNGTLISLGDLIYSSKKTSYLTLAQVGTNAIGIAFNSNFYKLVKSYDKINLVVMNVSL